MAREHRIEGAQPQAKVARYRRSGLTFCFALVSAVAVAGLHSYWLGLGNSAFFSLTSWFVWCLIVGGLAIAAIQLRVFHIAPLVPVFAILSFIGILLFRGPCWNAAFTSRVQARMDHALLLAWADSLSVQAPAKPGPPRQLEPYLAARPVQELWPRPPKSGFYHFMFADQQEPVIELRWTEGFCHSALWIGSEAEVRRFLDNPVPIADSVWYQRTLRR